MKGHISQVVRGTYKDVKRAPIINKKGHFKGTPPPPARLPLHGGPIANIVFERHNFTPHDCVCCYDMVGKKKTMDIYVRETDFISHGSTFITINICISIVLLQSTILYRLGLLWGFCGLMVHCKFVV